MQAVVGHLATLKGDQISDAVNNDIPEGLSMADASALVNDESLILV